MKHVSSDLNRFQFTERSTLFMAKVTPRLTGTPVPVSLVKTNGELYALADRIKVQLSLKKWHLVYHSVSD